MIRRLLMLVALLGATFPALADNHSDRVHFGHDIVIAEGQEAHDAVCFLCSIEINGTVHGDTVAFLGSITIRGHADRDVVDFAGNVDMGQGASIGRDVVVFAGSLHSDSSNTIGRDSVVFPFFIFLIPIGVFVSIVWLIVHLIRRNRVIYPPPPPGYIPQM